MKTFALNVKFKEFKYKEFKSNEALKNQIESQSHLSDEEMSLKQKLEESIKKFFELYE